MADEVVGGISVTIGGTDAELLTVIADAEAKLKALHDKYGNTVINITGRADIEDAPQGGARRSGSAPTPRTDAELTTAIRNLTAAMGNLGAAFQNGIRTAPARQQPPAQPVYRAATTPANGSWDVGAISQQRIREAARAQGFDIGPDGEPVAATRRRRAPRSQTYVAQETAAPVGGAGVSVDIGPLTEALAANTAATEQNTATLSSLRDASRTTTAPSAPDGVPGAHSHVMPTVAAVAPTQAETHATLLAVSRDRAGLAAVSRAARAATPPVERQAAARESIEAADEVQRVRIQPNITVTRLPSDPEAAANRREFATRERMFRGEIRSAEEAGNPRRRATPAEQELLETMFPSPAIRRARAGYRLNTMGPAPLANAEGGRGAGFAPQRETPPTDEEVHAGRGVPRTGTRVAQPAGQRAAYQTPQEEERRRRETLRQETTFGRSIETGAAGLSTRTGMGAFRRQAEEARIQRAMEQAIITREAEVQSAGRTARTQASSLGGFFFGPRKEQIEAQAGLNAARQQTASATKYRSLFEQEIIRNEVRATTATTQHARALRARNEEIRQSPDYAAAVQGETKAIEDEVKATERLGKLSTGASTALRSLAAVSLGGAAFGAGMKAVDLAISALVPAGQEAFAIWTGFGVTSTRVTTELGKQARAFKGNTEAALASAEATAGLDTKTADYLNTQLRLVTQVKAGAQALTDQTDLFRAGLGAGNAPTGAFGGYGGVLGTSFMAQQMGGGMGGTEQIAKNMRTFGGGGGPNLLGDFNMGLAYANPFESGVRDTTNKFAKQQGGGGGALATVSEIPGGIGDMISSFLPGSANSRWSPATAGMKNSQGVPYGETPPLASTITTEGQAYLNNLNAGAERAKQRFGDATQASYVYTNSLDRIAKATSVAAAAGDVYGVQLAQQGIILQRDGQDVTDFTTYLKDVAQVVSGAGIQDPQMMARASLAQARQSILERQAGLVNVPEISSAEERIRQQEYRASAAARLSSVQFQQEYERPAFMGQLTRGAEQQIGRVNPVNAYLQNLANPPLPVGTGIRFGGTTADRQAGQARVTPQLAAAQQEQDTLNAYYAKGQQIIEDTYKPAILRAFGQTGVAAFSGLLAKATEVSTTIASIQTGITNAQANYAAAQYTNELRIARRSYTDILQLTGQIGRASGDNLGIYERQNLLLGRQAQQLQFMLSQRQINLQTALAGFTVPGLTPAEQNARVTEAKVETDYAQKQLDIQKKMFGNQVKIVDISNLRQATDLMHSIGLLQQGYKVTMDTKVAQQRLERLGKIQSAIMADISVYTGVVDGLSGKAISDMAAQEAATGKAISRTAAAGVAAAYSVGRAFYLGISGGFLGDNKPKSSDSRPKVPTHAASGALFNTSGSTDMTVGEAGTETVAVLRNPRPMTGGMGGGDSYFTIPIVVQLDGKNIYQNVITRMGRDAATRGFRSPN
jgi:hypothetical protein